MRSRVNVTVGCPSIRLSVCPVDRQQQQREAGLLRAGDIQAPRTCSYQSVDISAAGSGAQQQMLRAEERRSTQSSIGLDVTVYGADGQDLQSYIDLGGSLLQPADLHVASTIMAAPIDDSAGSQLAGCSPGGPGTSCCAICNDRATGKHYGASSCDGCKVASLPIHARDAARQKQRTNFLLCASLLILFVSFAAEYIPSGEIKTFNT